VEKKVTRATIILPRFSKLDVITNEFLKTLRIVKIINKLNSLEMSAPALVFAAPAAKTMTIFEDKFTAELWASDDQFITW